MAKPQYRELLRNGKYGIYRLDNGGEDFEVDIVFLHGLQSDIKSNYEAWHHTWTSTEDGKQVFWPAEWLPQEEGFDRARILSVSYEASRKAVQGKEEFLLDEAAGSVLLQLISQSVAVGWMRRKVVLVGHSMGGLIINAMIVEAKSYSSNQVRNQDESNRASRAAAFLEHLRGLVYYATPHSGAPLASNWWLSIVLKPSTCNEPLLRYLMVFNRTYTRIKAKLFGSIPDNLPRMCFFETEPMKLPWIFGGPQVIVPEGSATLQPCTPVRVYADHINIVKPTSKKEVAYQDLVKFIQQVLDEPTTQKPAVRAIPGQTQPPQVDSQVAQVSGWRFHEKCIVQGDLVITSEENFSECLRHVGRLAVKADRETDRGTYISAFYTDGRFMGRDQNGADLRPEKSLDAPLLSKDNLQGVFCRDILVPTGWILFSNFDSPGNDHAPKKKLEHLERCLSIEQKTEKTLATGCLAFNTNGHMKICLNNLLKAINGCDIYIYAPCVMSASNYLF